MGLFQKKSDSTNSMPLYKLNIEKSFLIIGLGNPGEEYKLSRHNAGFMVMNKFAELNDFGNWQVQKKLQASTATAQLGNNRVILAKPQTFMNHSGLSASQLQNFFKISNHCTLVVYDELALPFGQLRARLGGSDAGHNGVKSLIEHIGDDFGRLRLGIAGEKPIKDTSKFVLANFSKIEQSALPDVLKEACAMISEFIYGAGLPHDTRTVL